MKILVFSFIQLIYTTFIHPYCKAQIEKELDSRKDTLMLRVQIGYLAQSQFSHQVRIPLNLNKLFHLYLDENPRNLFDLKLYREDLLHYLTERMINDAAFLQDYLTAYFAPLCHSTNSFLRSISRVRSPGLVQFNKIMKRLAQDGQLFKFRDEYPHEKNRIRFIYESRRSGYYNSYIDTCPYRHNLQWFFNDYTGTWIWNDEFLKFFKFLIFFWF